ncbi:CDC27 family protein [Parabacteroides chinchillae]|uniref:Tetratricopeptide repeat-containing protein n=1 Tax=Parabacteroides chinchillae TaxID=871327 RepID=A0A8G2BTY0_9BACT|nr:CDC27 family protein [Parabacteroides chinchillae]SEF39988.1 Tetratricopeptide repeat-containing protein [Parabacteroides chinchillae]
MKKDDISRLLQRYLDTRDSGKEPYFDADEIDDLLESFEESDDYAYYDEILELGLKLHPNNTTLKIRECRRYAYNDNYEEALALIENIGETNNEDLDILRIECYCYTDQSEKAIKFAKDLISNDCEYSEAIFECIIPILNDLDFQKEARELLELGLTIFPDNQLLKNELCFLLEAEGKIQEAIDICNELIDKNPYSNDYWFTLGRLYSMIPDYDKAIEAFDFALTCDDSDPELKVLRGYCLYMNENYEKALEAYKEVIDSESFYRVKPLMAECYVKLERFDEGYKLLKEILKQTDTEKDPSVYVNFIRCCLETEREKEATSMLNKTIKLFPDNVRILSLLALTYLENDHEEQALQITDYLFKAIDSAEEEGTKEGCDSLLRAGQYLYLKGDIEKALLYYKKILQRNPDIPHMNIHMAMAYLSLGDIKRFQEYYEQTSPVEMMNFLKKSGINLDKIDLNNPFISRHIPPEDLAKEFLKNKDNSN